MAKMKAMDKVEMMDKVQVIERVEILPAYAPTDQDKKDPYAADDTYADITSAFASLKIAGNSSTMDPTPELCLAHLKLLHVFDRLKRDIQGHDGLFGIYDARVEHSQALKDARDRPEAVQHKTRQKELTDMREKRWALYVARAVARYEQWWDALPGDKLTESQRMELKGDWCAGWRTMMGKKVEAIRNETTITTANMPTIDVIMVWHTHFLNPRHYLSDCLRFGKLRLWERFPWAAVNTCIDADLEFRPPTDAAARWTSLTSASWANEDGPDHVMISCPGCKTPYKHPWTTAGAPEDATR